MSTSTYRAAHTAGRRGLLARLFRRRPTPVPVATVDDRQPITPPPAPALPDTGRHHEDPNRPDRGLVPTERLVDQRWSPLNAATRNRIAPSTFIPTGGNAAIEQTGHLDIAALPVDDDIDLDLDVTWPITDEQRRRVLRPEYQQRIRHTHPHHRDEN